MTTIGGVFKGNYGMAWAQMGVRLIGKWVPLCREVVSISLAENRSPPK